MKFLQSFWGLTNAFSGSRILFFASNTVFQKLATSLSIENILNKKYYASMTFISYWLWNLSNRKVVEQIILRERFQTKMYIEFSRIIKLFREQIYRKWEVYQKNDTRHKLCIKVRCLETPYMMFSNIKTGIESNIEIYRKYININNCASCL